MFLVQRSLRVLSLSENVLFFDNITQNMRGYYAFSWWRYKHAMHPMTTAVIVETGFLTSPIDREVLIDSPEIPASGIASGIIKYLESESLVE